MSVSTGWLVVAAFLATVTNRLKENYPDIEWPVFILNANDAEADALLAALDPIAVLAEAESFVLDALLKTVETESAAARNLLTRLAVQEDISLDSNEFSEYDESIAEQG